VGAGYRVLPFLVLGLNYYNLENNSALRENGADKQEIAWTGHALNAYVQGDLHFGRRRLLNLFARVGVGMSWAWTTFDAVPRDRFFPDQSPALETTGAGTEKVTQNFLRPAGFFGLGVQVMPGRYLGFQAELRHVFADAIENNFGEHHNMGGFALIFSVRARTWE
jgi:hypothetical protein